MKNSFLFRGKRLDNGEWVFGHYYEFMGKHYIFESPFTSKNLVYEVDPTTVCRCTGLNDKNGKLIRENDIANCSTEGCYGYIGWNESEAGFYFNALLEDGRFEEEHIYDYQDCMEVIGNTFDNPELLEV